MRTVAEGRIGGVFALAEVGRAGFVGGEFFWGKRGALVRALAESAVRRMDEFDNPEFVGITMNRATQGAITAQLMAEILCAGFEDE